MSNHMSSTDLSNGETVPKTGLMRGTVTLEMHRSEWETLAQQTIQTLRWILRENITDAQHVGSTAIKGICAKPIIDLVVGVPDFQPMLSQNDLLAEYGFLFRGQDHPDQYLYICGEGDFITHHIHVVIYRSEYWNNYINMRDYLNTHDADAQAYAALKASLAKQYPDDRNTYTAMKSAFICEILAKARQWRKTGQP